jgi:hypothetical protein
MIHKKYLRHFIFLLLIVPALFLSLSQSVSATTGPIMCNGTFCGNVGLANSSTSVCTITGKANVGGQTCYTNDSVTGVSDSNNAMTFTKQQGYIPTTYNTTDIYSDYHIFPNSPVSLTFDTVDDNGGASVGSASYNYNGCPCGINDVSDPTTSNKTLNCGSAARSAGSATGLASPGDQINLTVINACKPNDNMNSTNSSGAYGGGSAHAQIEVTSCYNSTYYTWQVDHGYFPESSRGKSYTPTAPGVCTFNGTGGGTPKLTASLSSTDITLSSTSIPSVSDTINYSNSGSTNLTGITCSDIKVVMGSARVTPPFCDEKISPGQSGAPTNFTVSGLSNLGSDVVVNVTVSATGVNPILLPLTIHPAPVSVTPSGALSATGCLVADGNSSCNASVTWTTKDLVAGTATGVTHNNPSPDTSSVAVSSNTSGSGVASTIKYGTTTFYLYNDSNQLASGSVYAACANKPWDSVAQTCSASSATIKPDLQIFGDVSPISVVAGTPVVLSASVINLGSVSTGKAFSNYFSVSIQTRNQSITTFDLTPSSVGILAAGGMSTATTTYTFPIVGTYTVGICADMTSRNGGGVIDESDELNNCVSTTVTALPSSVTPPSCGTDNRASLASAPTNLCGVGTAGTVTGSGPWFWSCNVPGAGLPVSCQASKSTVVNSGNGCGSPAAGSVTPTTNLCQPGYSNNSVSLDQANAAYVWTCADGNIAHYSVCSSSYTGPVNAVCGIDKNLQAPSVPSSNLCYAGSAAGTPTHNVDDTYSWTCNGTGTPNGSNAACSTQQANISCTITSLTATPANVLSGGTALLSWTTDSNCDSGYLVLADNTRYNTCYIDEDTGRSVCPNWPPNNIQEPTGTYTLTMTGAPYNGHTGTSTRSVTIGTASPSPDLIAGAVTPNTATANVSKTFYSTITNQGSTATGGSFPTFFQVATAVNGGGTITDLTSSTVSNLPPGGNNTATKSYTFTANGIYSMRACADKTSSSGGGVVTEVDETNNCGVWTTITATGANVPPVVSAGPNKNIVPPISTVSVTGTATDPDGTISSTLWNFVSGPATATVVSPTALSTTFTGLTVNGIYIFRLSAWDNLSATSSAQMQVTVGAPVSLSPLTASPSTLYQRKDATTITWSSTGATACVGDSFPSSYTKNGILSEINSPFKGTRVLSGSISLNPPVSTSYTLTCTGAGGTATQSVQVKTVFPSATEQ